MHCMGMCHLKKIFKDHGKEQQDPGSQGKVWQESIGLPELLPTIYFILPSENFLQEIFYLNKLPLVVFFRFFIHRPDFEFFFCIPELFRLCFDFLDTLI